MKIGMDAVILAAFSAQTDCENALDIGCGCGILSLMIAQKTNGEIFAIDIDEAAVSEADSNFQWSNWSDRLSVKHISLQEFLKNTEKKFDKIICNPPYFKNSLKSEDIKRNLARHDESLTFEELAKAVSKLLSRNGHFDVILPYDSGEEMEKLMSIEGLHLHSQMLIRNYKDEKPIRTIQHYSANEQIGLKCNSLMIYNADGKYSDQFRYFTRDFYLNFGRTKQNV
ncbi:MAG: methyltransferase [Bacteroidales bacterium]|nr:methyltransferase [Bacteroidales bacterium]